MSTIGSTAIPAARADRASSIRERMRSDPAYQGFMLLRIGFTVAPIVFGLDKFTNVLVDWTQYLAPWINDIIPGSASDAMVLCAESLIAEDGGREAVKLETQVLVTDTGAERLDSFPWENG